MGDEDPRGPFIGFPKIGRYASGCVITEKVDGTNAQIVIRDGKIAAVGSRTRWLSPGKETDNFGFAGWVAANADELMKLGDGQHFGEWYGNGIQRTYGLAQKRFALFNTSRWSHERPSCCDIVPVLYTGPLTQDAVDDAMLKLSYQGSHLVPGFMNPEGIVIYTGRTLLKKTFDNDGGKWAAVAA